MKKVLVTIEMEVDENELAKIENHKEDYENNMTLEKWAEGIQIVYTGDGYVEVGNDIEKYYNENIGTSKVLQGISVKEFSIQE